MWRERVKRFVNTIIYVVIINVPSLDTVRGRSILSSLSVSASCVEIGSEINKSNTSSRINIFQYFLTSFITVSVFVTELLSH